VVILLGHVMTLLSAVFIGTLLWFAAKAGSNPVAAWDRLAALFQGLLGG
jgi:hypothetical protein